MPKIKNIPIISQNALGLLESLAIYRYLTVAQMAKIGILQNASNIRKRVIHPILKVKKPLVAEFHLQEKRTNWRLPYVYILTKHGAETLAEYQRTDPASIHYPIRKNEYTADFWHRSMFIDLHIALRQWARESGAEMEFFDSYFDKTGSQRGAGDRLQSMTHIRCHLSADDKFDIIPDGIFRFEKAGISRLCVLEMHNNHETGKIYEQIKRNIIATANDLITNRYGHQTQNYILSVHEHQHTLEGVRRRVLANIDFQEFWPIVLFNTQETLKQDFSKGWVTAEGKEATLFA